MRFQFRFELFNAFNHPNFFSGRHQSGRLQPIPAINNFGRITSAYPARSLQFAGKILLLAFAVGQEIPFNPWGEHGRGRLGRKSLKSSYYSGLPAFNPSIKGRSFDDRENFRVIYSRSRIISAKNRSAFPSSLSRMGHQERLELRGTPGRMNEDSDIGLGDCCSAPGFALLALGLTFQIKRRRILHQARKAKSEQAASKTGKRRIQAKLCRMSRGPPRWDVSASLPCARTFCAFASLHGGAAGRRVLGGSGEESNPQHVWWRTSAGTAQDAVFRQLPRGREANAQKRPRAGQELAENHPSVADLDSIRQSFA